MGFTGRLPLRVVHVILEPDDRLDWRARPGGPCNPRPFVAAGPHRMLTYFICGPEPMTDAVQRDLRTLGVPLRRIHVELFDMV
jgi:ferredoxin-NADP reductase